MGMYSVIKGLFSLSLLVLIAGVLQGSFMVGVLCALFFAIPACILFFVLYTREKREAENAKRDLASKLSAKQEKCNTVLPNVKSVYDDIFNSMGCNEDKAKIRVLMFQTLQELSEHQAEGDYWRDCFRECYCWIDTVSEEYGVRALCLLETFNTVKKGVQLLPDSYDTEEKATCMVWRRYIPFEDMLQLQALGTVYQTSAISGGENITYRGISANGIGFGEFECDPIKIEQKLHDTRILALYYKDSIEQALFFPQEALSTLINLIPFRT